jgi:hypothetical protein
MTTRFVYLSFSYTEVAVPHSLVVEQNPFGHGRDPRGQCYGHHFKQFSPTFDKFFLKNQCCYPVFAKVAAFETKRSIYCQSFRNFKRIIQIMGPRWWLFDILTSTFMYTYMQSVGTATFKRRPHRPADLLQLSIERSFFTTLGVKEWASSLPGTYFLSKQQESWCFHPFLLLSFSPTFLA